MASRVGFEQKGSLGLTASELLMFETLTKKIINSVVARAPKEMELVAPISVATGFELSSVSSEDPENAIMVFLSCGSAKMIIRDAIRFAFSNNEIGVQ